MSADPQPPAEDDLVSALTALRASHPDSGAPKLLAQLKASRPDWAVSEKRVRKVLSTLGVGAGAGSSSSGGQGRELVARTGVDTTLDVAALAPKVEVRMFGGTKGKGLVARAPVEAGELLWHEEPWIACPDPALRPALSSGSMCTHCLALFPQPDPPLSASCAHCSARFCNRLCASRAAASSHPALLCPGQNPAAAELERAVVQHEWRALDVVARLVARWRAEREDGRGETAARVWEGTARVDMHARMSERADWAATKDAHVRSWRAAHALVVRTLNPSPVDPAFKPVQAILSARRGRRKPAPLTPDEVKRWFSYESFLQLLGLANINMEDSGGLYALHAHLNHSCEPNVQVRNLPRSYLPPTQAELPAPLPPPNPPGTRGTHKLTLLARRAVAPGDEFTISYVDFNMPRSLRRDALREGYGFWCACARCAREAKGEGKGAGAVADSEGGPDTADGVAGETAQ
ncbi:hypothetical protein Q5752_005248 [Cryptotrichosporon argae]